jgi:hypothetical protein
VKWRRSESVRFTWTDADQIAAQTAAGIDLSHPRRLDHCIYIFDAERANDAASRLTAAGYEVSSRFCGDHEPPEWEIVASRVQRVTAESLASTREFIESITTPLDEYDGWNVGDVTKDGAESDTD